MASVNLAGLNSEIANISRDEFDDLLALANTNHVIVRGLEAFLRIMSEARNDIRAGWAETALATERARIENAMSFLHAICDAFEEDGFDVTVIKSLDHWPDLGSDLDLYTNANSEEISATDEEALPGANCTAKLGRSPGAQMELPYPRTTRGSRDSHGPPGPDWRTGHNRLAPGWACPDGSDWAACVSRARGARIV